ncbi:MAG TPA: HAMP domain-containing histidine kinase [Bacteroidetes bacterium]|nr:HAMP domain-containing histidine kinase [Bacteroidota bacterium]
MKFLKKILRKGNLKIFIIFWTTVIILSITVLSSLLFLTGKKFQNLTREILYYSKVNELTHLLESSILSERRNDLLAQKTLNKKFGRSKKLDLTGIQELLNEIDIQAKRREDEQKINQMEIAFHRMLTGASDSSLASVENMNVLTDRLLREIERFRNQNRELMARAVEKSQQWNRLEDEYLTGLILFVVFIVMTGALFLYRRIVHPTVRLSRTVAKFGQGDFAARAPVINNDEIGRLCCTFNNMADDIAGREKVKREFIASIVHDIKNPLVFIGGAAGILKGDSLNPEQQKFWLERIIKNVQQLENLAADLMDNIQVQTGHLSLQLKAFDLADLIRDIHLEQNKIVTSHSIQFEGDGECTVYGDEKRLERVAVNLISNAVKYSPKNSTIFLKVKRRESYISFFIEDRGAGISQNDLPVLFQPFGRLRATERTIKGSGMGLFVVKKIVEAHGGAIKVNSEVGVGTIFEIKLPKMQ